MHTGSNKPIFDRIVVGAERRTYRSTVVVRVDQRNSPRTAWERNVAQPLTEFQDQLVDWLKTDLNLEIPADIIADAKYLIE